MKSLKHVQIIAQVLSILTKIAFVLCIIGATCLVIASILLMSFPQIGVSVANAIDITEIINSYGAGVTNGEVHEVALLASPLLGALLLAVAITVTGAAVVLGFTDSYFKGELAEGTPFTYRGAKALLRIGILGLAIPVGTAIVSTIIVSAVVNTAVNFFPEAVAYLNGIDLSISVGADLTLGVTALLLSFVFRYGADLLAEKPVTADEKKEP